ncbi:2069_t:CDS:2, partial [Funneliformis mosseae]
MDKGIDERLLKFIFERRLGVENVLNPIKLHSYFWKHSSSILAELALAKMIPDIIIQIEGENDEDNLLSDVGFEKYLVEKVIQDLLYRITTTKDRERLKNKFILEKWQYEVTKVLSLCEKINVTSKLYSLRLLRICNDILITKSIPLENIKQIINYAQHQKIASSDIELQELAYTLFYHSNNQTQFDQIFQQYNDKSPNLSNKLLLFGIVMSKFHSIRASREWNQNERVISQQFSNRLVNLTTIPEKVKATILNVLANTQSLLKINQGISNDELLMKSVLTHIIGLHTLLEPQATPLSMYMHRIGDAQNTFVLTCQSDIETESEKETHRLVDYMTDMSLNLWPSNNDIEEILNQLFPHNLLVSNSLASYEYVLQKKKSMGINSNKPIMINTFNSQTITSSNLNTLSSPTQSIHSSRKGKKVDR